MSITNTIEYTHNIYIMKIINYVNLTVIYSIVFNTVKSKLMCFNSVSSDMPYLTLCGKPVDVVDNDLHLGNRIYNNIYTQLYDIGIFY